MKNPDNVKGFRLRVNSDGTMRMQMNNNDLNLYSSQYGPKMELNKWYSVGFGVDHRYGALEAYLNGETVIREV